MASAKLTFESREYPDASAVTLEKCDLLFMGEWVVDDRTKAAVAALQSTSNRVVKLGIDDSLNLTLDSQDRGQRRLEASIQKTSKIRIETTTLGLAEIIRVIQTARDAGVQQIEFIYIEPKDYTEITPVYAQGGSLHHREFTLTENRSYRGFNGFNHEHSPKQAGHHVFFLGFEPSRLEVALEQRADLDPSIYDLTAVVGVPAFVPGWENNVLASHAETLKSRGFLPGSFRYCTANSPRDAYLLLWDLYAQTATAERIFYVSPLGTKPHAVGAALFLVETKGYSGTTSLYYDHPQRRKDRSKEVGRWHVWTVRLPP